MVQRDRENNYSHNSPTPLPQGLNPHLIPIWARDTEPLPVLTPTPLPQGQNLQSRTTSQSSVIVVVLGIVTVLAVIFMLVLLNNFEILPHVLIVVTSSIYQVLTGIAVVYVLLALVVPKSFRQRIENLPRRTLRMLAISSLIILAVVPTLGWWGSLLLMPPPLCSSKPSPSIAKLNPFFEQSIPNYNNPDGVVWYAHKDTYASPCISGSISGLLIQQKSRTLYAEIDLQQVNHNSYNQTNFDVETRIKFVKPDDPANPATLAGLLIQTPAPTSLSGGYAFLLNSHGQWQLIQSDEGDAIHASDHIVASGFVEIDVQQPVILRIHIQSGMLYGYINKRRVTSHIDDLPKKNESWSREIGLVVELQLNAPSSQVLFSNFVLDQKV